MHGPGAAAPGSQLESSEPDGLIDTLAIVMVLSTPWPSRYAEL